MRKIKKTMYKQRELNFSFIFDKGIRSANAMTPVEYGSDLNYAK